MLHLDTPSFRLDLLDPNGDADRQGSRYVRGGYLWQAHDRNGNPLFAGPRYPESNNTYDGQGAPEAFRWYDVRQGRFLNLDDGRVLVPGVGVIQPSIYVEKMIEVVEVAPWEVTMDANGYRMTCSQGYAGRAYHLERQWTAESNALISHTRIRMTGERAMDVHWFAHPFFPPAPGGACFDPGPDASLPADSHAYFNDAQGRIQIKTEGYNPRLTFQLLELRGTPRMNASLAHPQCGHVRITGDFPLASLPVWFNYNTFSPEPHLEGTMSPGEEKSWSLRYDFGENA